MPSTGVPSVLFHVITSVSPNARSRTCGLTSVSFRGDANVRSLTYTSAGAFDVPNVYAASRPSRDSDGWPISTLSTMRLSLPDATSYEYTAAHARSPVVNSTREPSGVQRGLPAETSTFGSYVSFALPDATSYRMRWSLPISRSMILSARAAWLCGSMVNAIVFPSGDHAGGDPASGFVVIFVNDLSAIVTM